MGKSIDDYSAILGTLESPARRAVAIVPSDTEDLGRITRSLYVGGVGDLSVILVDDGAAVLFVAVPAGSFLPIRASRVRATGTTATNLVGLW